MFLAPDHPKLTLDDPFEFMYILFWKRPPNLKNNDLHHLQPLIIIIEAGSQLTFVWNMKTVIDRCHIEKNIFKS